MIIGKCGKCATKYIPKYKILIIKLTNKIHWFDER